MQHSEALFPLRAEWQKIQALALFPLGAEWLPAGELHPEPAYVGFPLRSEWEAAQPKTLAEYPAPALTSRDRQAVEMPSAVAKLAQFAREASWEVRAQSSMGQIPHGSTGRPGAVKRLIALRFGAHPMTERQAYVVYEAPATAQTWKPRSIMIWGPDLPPYAHLSMNEFRTYLRDVTRHSAEQIGAWVAAIEQVRQDSEAMRKRRATVRAQIRKVAQDGQFRAAQQEDRREWFKVDEEWRAKVKDLQDGVFTSDEVAVMIDPERLRGPRREGL